MFQGKQILEKFLVRIEQALEQDPFGFVRSGIRLTEDELNYLQHPNLPRGCGMDSIPDLLEHFLERLRQRIPEEIFLLESYLQTFVKIIDQLTHILKTVRDLDAKNLSLARRGLQDITTNQEIVVKALRKRNLHLTRNRRSDPRVFQEPVDQAIAEYHLVCDRFAEKLIELLPGLPSQEVRRLVGVLRNVSAPLITAFDRELKSEPDSRGRIQLVYSPDRLLELRNAIIEFVRHPLFHLQTARKRALMYKPPTIDPAEIMARFQEIRRLIGWFCEQEQTIPAANIFDQERKLRIAVYPTGKITSPYTRAVTSKGKETRMVEGFYYQQSHVLLISGTAGANQEPEDVSEVERIFGEYVHDTLALHTDWIRDPIGAGKEKGNYYSVIKRRLCPDLTGLLEDRLDLRYWFSEDFVRFIACMEGRQNDFPRELFDWFVANLVDRRYEPGTSSPPAGNHPFGLQ